MEYKEWRNFQKVLDKAMIACKLSNNNVSNHFVGFNKTVPMPSGAKPKTIGDYKLSRYACYLIVQNGDSKKQVIALGQTYFAVQTRKMELFEEEYYKLAKNEKRLYGRKQTREGNKNLYKIAKEKGIKNFDRFTNVGYKGLYNGGTMPEELPTPKKSVKEIEQEMLK